MTSPQTLTHSAGALMLTLLAGGSAMAATTVHIGSTGKTFASSGPQCAVNPATGVSAPTVQAGLFNPVPHLEAEVRLNGVMLKEVQTTSPATDVWLANGSNKVTVAINKRLTDTYVFAVSAGQCSLPVGNYVSPDGTLEYAASGKSYTTVAPACALNPATGLTQPYVNLFDNGTFLLNVSVNGKALTQLSTTRPKALVFLSAGQNVITAANGTASTDTFLRDGGSGTCVLP
jgi:hypothetical protein